MLLWKRRSDVYKYLIMNGFLLNYTKRVYHGEREMSILHTFATDNEDHLPSPSFVCDNMHGIWNAGSKDQPVIMI